MQVSEEQFKIPRVVIPVSLSRLKTGSCPGQKPDWQIAGKISVKG